MTGHHGNTPAAWTGVSLGLLGFLVASISLMLEPVSMTLFWIGVAIGVLALVVFVVMARLGMNPSEHEASGAMNARADGASGSSEHGAA